MTASQPDRSQVKGAHMVSSGYISAWADTKNVIAVLDLEEGIGYHKSYKKATVVNYVYEPALLNYDLEGEYARIESAGIRVIRMLRDGLELTVEERTQLIEFLEMHRYRGRYADRAEVGVPGVAMMSDGAARDIELRLGDMTLLTRDREPGPKLTELGLEQWEWTMWEVDDFPTGDGAVMLWGSSAGRVSVVTFPLSPTQLLLIGDELPEGVPFKMRLAMNCRRWIVGKKGTLNFKQAAIIAAERDRERAEGPA
ncbi:DUF4238 domain-containing protein [Plantibacter sp. VKM Ac-2876]|uniref:DUF4238 domain-containing protein n=1 Tax=Plantibacter sp. VKM Ac-2876 TaxID=2783826 RepID=UPI00188B27C8|nr:DUF4238 domain-containing protein [Plantibacter sp. VKM Ac-2876]MBF4565413.1 DUF4238 domain-containing protein [Plantibacter sp. VKM Ac-2876]